MYMKGILKDENGKVINKGDEVTSFRGEKAIVKGWDSPNSPASTGRIYVKTDAFDELGFYPSVYGLHIEI